MYPPVLSLLNLSLQVTGSSTTPENTGLGAHVCWGNGQFPSEISKGKVSCKKKSNMFQVSC